ncbi:MAG: septum formation initiator family protein [Deltaproteobacteria bacterium]|nr:septum formation initiator family protein [Deltaproteobacteria bacterium]
MRIKSENLFNRRYAVLAVILLIAGWAIFGDKGLVDVYRLIKERDGMIKHNVVIEAKNRALEEEIRLLNTDKRYIGYVARRELGMIGKNELLYKLEDAPKGAISE